MKKANMYCWYTYVHFVEGTIERNSRIILYTFEGKYLCTSTCIVLYFFNLKIILHVPSTL